MTLTTQIIPIEYVNGVLPQVEEFIEAALVHSKGDYTLDEVRVLLTQGTWQLLIVLDEEQQIHGCATIQFFNRPRDRVAFITTIGGNLITNKESFQDFVATLRMFGATSIEGAVRKSMARFLRQYGFQDKYQIVGFKI